MKRMRDLGLVTLAATSLSHFSYLPQFLSSPPTLFESLPLLSIWVPRVTTPAPPVGENKESHLSHFKTSLFRCPPTSWILAVIHEIKLLNTSIQGLNTTLENTEFLSLNSTIEGLKSSVQGLNTSIQGLNGSAEKLSSDLNPKFQELNSSIQTVTQQLEWFDPDPQADINDPDISKVASKLGKEKEKMKDDYLKKLARAEAAMSAVRSMMAQVLVILVSLSTATLSSNHLAGKVVIWLFVPVISAVKLSFYLAVYGCYIRLKAIGLEVQGLLVKKDSFKTKLKTFEEMVSRRGRPNDMENPQSPPQSPRQSPEAERRREEIVAKLKTFKKEMDSVENVTTPCYVELVLTTFLSTVQAVVLIVLIFTTHHKVAAAVAPPPVPT
ncbi:unnamed protein product [Cuscuta campestris]|uniref:Uncharacterized protein n=1 Tax=Cuscuta campestris TaxID=132261 RepID=A0A484LX29_9ASTE|nr:unnamed protein product [Cuscuta campestris]